MEADLADSILPDWARTRKTKQATNQSMARELVRGSPEVRLQLVADNNYLDL